MKRKYDSALERLENTTKRLYNANRREKRARKTIADILEELRENRNLNEKAHQMLEAYKGILYTKKFHIGNCAFMIIKFFLVRVPFSN